MLNTFPERTYIVDSGASLHIIARSALTKKEKQSIKRMKQIVSNLYCWFGRNDNTSIHSQRVMPVRKHLWPLERREALCPANTPICHSI